MTHFFNCASRQLAVALLIFSFVLGAAQADEASHNAEPGIAAAIAAGKPLTSFRLRYEQAEQANKAEQANAMTVRSLIGWQTAKFHDFSLTAQLINVSKLQSDYNDKKNNLDQAGKSAFPAVADPENTDINLLSLDWSGLPKTTLRAGRQSIKLDNTRFVGNVEFRQVMQVFDGIAAEYAGVADTEIYLAHFTQVKQINTLARSGQFDIVHAKYKLAAGESLTGYGYFSDFADLGAGAAAGLGASGNPSNKTLGLRLDGAHPFANFKLLYTAEYAKQTALANGDARINAYYAKLGGGAIKDGWYIRYDQEILSSNDGGYGFQTPFGTNHLFQGWADQFLVTPKQGIRDQFISVGGKPHPSLALTAEFHVMDAMNATGMTGSRYGNEIDVGATWTVNNKLWLRAEYADFREQDQLTAARKFDTRRLWLTMMLTY